MTAPKTFDDLVENLAAHGCPRSDAAGFLLDVFTFWSNEARRERLERFKRVAILPPFLRETVVTADNGHAGHVTHECRSAVRCSCGAIEGDIVIPADGPIPACEWCCLRGLE